MRINTRNFTLYLLLTAFVVVGISVTALSKIAGDTQVGSVLVGVSLPETTYTASASLPPSLDRVARAAELKQKIAARGPLVSIAESTVESVVPITPVVSSDNASLLLCPNHQPVLASWPSNGLSFAMVEGARVLQRMEPDPLSPGLETRRVYVQLPVQTSVHTIKSCIPYDIIGIALDGSAIRNNERDVYAVFGSETLLGYALDGFPLYGVSDKESDSCGGVVENGDYRYHLQMKREKILNCFAGNPVAI